MDYSAKDDNYGHTPVMVQETLHYLQPAPGKIIVDATLGTGGHTENLLKGMVGKGLVIGIDCDSYALETAKERLASWGDSFWAVYGNFRSLEMLLKKQGIKKVDGIIFDLGVSSLQLDSPSRGFTYRDDVPLDMRMDQTLSQTALQVLKELSRRELARVFKEYGEERWAEKIAYLIDRYRRTKGEIYTTGQLVDIIRKAVPSGAKQKRGHPAKRVFQALRIVVNKELDNLESGLIQGIHILKPGGRLVLISYHSLEDRIVKRYFKEYSRECICPPKMPICRCGWTSLLKVLNRRPLTPAREEIEVNPRAASARFRAAERIHSLISSDKDGR